MAAYMIVLSEITDTAWIADYVGQVSALMDKYGGVNVAMGQDVSVMEGSLSTPDAATIFRFPDRAAVEGFLNCDEYAPLRDLRNTGSAAQILIFESSV